MIDESKWGEKPNDEKWYTDRLKTFYSIIKNAYLEDDDCVIMIVKRNGILIKN